MRIFLKSEIFFGFLNKFAKTIMKSLQVASNVMMFKSTTKIFINFSFQFSTVQKNLVTIFLTQKKLMKIFLKSETFFGFFKQICKNYYEIFASCKQRNDVSIMCAKFLWNFLPWV